MAYLEENPNTFDDQLDRIHFMADTTTEEDLAGFLGIHPSEIDAARQRGKIPAEWLVTMMMAESILPEWILTGQGPCCTFDVWDSHMRPGGDDATARQADRAALRRLPSVALAKELVRRIAVAQTNGFVRWQEMDIGLG